MRKFKVQVLLTSLVEFEIEESMYPNFDDAIPLVDYIKEIETENFQENPDLVDGTKKLFDTVAVHVEELDD